MNALPTSAQRVADAARTAGLSIEVREMPQSTRTAEEAAKACGCSVGQIVKSLIFQGKTSGRAYLLLVSGSNRVDETGVADQIGEPLQRPDACFVRDVTGFAIGGVPPFGHATAIATFMDEDLLTFDRVFAAAGTPRAIFSVAPLALRAATDAAAMRVKV